MKERPILFSSDMVRELLSGRKTQTRRVVKPQPQSAQMISDRMASLCYPAMLHRACPYGAPGDRLWVRETHHVNHTGEVVHYRADYPVDGDPFNADECGEDHALEGEKWRPSIHMPRWASRLTLEVVAVRVERLQDIRPEDAVAEGIPTSKGVGLIDGETCYMMTTNSGYMRGPRGAVEAYKNLWESINGQCSWERNPWVWVIEFKLIGGAK